MSPYLRKSSGQELGSLTTLAFSQAGAVQNTWYDVCALVNIELFHFDFECLIADETLALETTIDSLAAVTTTKAATFGHGYQLKMASDYTGWYFQVTETVENQIGGASVPMKFAYFKTRMRKTTAGGASTLLATLIYRQL